MVIQKIQNRGKEKIVNKISMRLKLEDLNDDILKIIVDFVSEESKSYGILGATSKRFNCFYKALDLPKQTSLTYLITKEKIDELYDSFGFSIGPAVARTILCDRNRDIHEWCRGKVINAKETDDKLLLLVVSIVWKAAETGALEVVKEFWDISLDWDNIVEDVASLAAEYNHLHILRWIDEIEGDSQRFNLLNYDDLYHLADSNGNMQIVEWIQGLYDRT